jgi:Kelch motif/Galactose oxidase, central domain
LNEYRFTYALANTQQYFSIQIKPFFMRKIFFIPLFATLFIAACKKEAIETKAPADLEVNKVTTNAPVPCTGNSWGNPLLFINNGNDISQYNTRTLVYNNKAYTFKSGAGKVFIYDGIAWDSIPSAVPSVTYIAYGFGFTIGSKGYLGYAGASSSSVNYFWEYDFITNTWQPRTAFPGPYRNGVSSFSIGNKGYLVGGYKPQFQSNGIANPINYRETWEYNPATNSWQQKANLNPFTGRAYATGFSIGNKGYIVNGKIELPTNPLSSSTITHYVQTLQEFDPVANAWALKASFPGAGRAHTAAFVINGGAYAGGGYDGSNNLNNFYKYSPATDAWVQIADCPGTPNSPGFSINSRGYILAHENPIFNPSLPMGETHMYKYTAKICNPQGASQ